MRPRLLALLVCAAASVALPALAQQAPAPMPARISVTGEGQASRAPDLAITRLTVLRSAETAAAALKATNEAMNAVTNAMPALGVEARDLQTSGFQIAPQYRYDNRPDGTQSPPTLTGYEVRNTLTVRIRDLARIGDVLDKAVQLGVNEGGSIDFQIEDMAAASDEARRQAVRKARDSAAALAEAAGVKLGRIVTIEDGGSSALPPPPMPMAEMRMAAPMDKVPVSVGENAVTAQVRMVFEITP